MQTEAIFVHQQAPEFREFVQLVWGYSELASRAFAAGEDPTPFLTAIASASERLSFA